MSLVQAPAPGTGEESVAGSGAAPARGGATAPCPACGVSTPRLRARVPWYARLDPLARAVAGRGLLRCPACGHRWPADDAQRRDTEARSR